MVTWLLALAWAADNPSFPSTATVYQLENGLRVVIDEDRRTDTVATHLELGIGSRDEQPGQYGCAHLFEHLMFEGSQHVPTNQFDRWLTAAGGSNNAYTSEDETAYHMTFPSGALDLALFLESDRFGFLDAGIDAENLRNQQDVVLQERYQGYAEPHGRDFDALVRLQFPDGHPYHVATIGTVQDVRGFTVDAVTAFWRDHYRPRNAILAVVGNVDPQDAIGRVATWFADVPDTGPAPERIAWSPNWTYAPTDGVLYDDVEDRTLYVSWATVPDRHPDAPALEVLSWILENGRGSRMYDQLMFRRQVATDVSAMSWTSEIDGQFVLAATSAHVPLRRLERHIERALWDVVRNPPTHKEIARARTAILGDMLDGLEHPESRAEALVHCVERYGDPNCLDDEWARTMAVETEDIVGAMQRWLRPDRRITLSVVPRDDNAGIPGAIDVELP